MNLKDMHNYKSTIENLNNIITLKVLLPVCILMVFFGSMSAQKLSPQAQRQLKSLIDEKESRTPAQQKINSQILYASKMQSGRRLTPEVSSLRVGVKKDANGFITTNITATVSPQLLNDLRQMGCRIISSSVDHNNIAVSIPLARVEEIAALKGITYIDYWMPPITNNKLSDIILDNVKIDEEENSYPSQSALSPENNGLVVPTPNERANHSTNIRKSVNNALSDMLVGSVTSEGDVTHGADVARANFGLLGAGIKIGVISDSYNNLAGAAANVIAGDLPGIGNPFGYTTPVTVLSDYVQPSPPTTLPSIQTDEGRAMLQIVHDLAPAAELYFATAFYTEAEFAQAIVDLRNAGCDIIVDDISYAAESVWQDGVIAKAINTVTADGAMYFSSAGNAGNLNDGTSGVWEGDFADGGSLPLFPGGTLHDFGGGQLYNTITNPGLFHMLTWSDKWGASTNDYDMIITNSEGTAILETSMNGNIPFAVEWVGGPLNAGERVYILKKDGADTRALRLTTTRGKLAVGTQGATYGHNSASNTITVAASPSTGPFPNKFNAANKVETFSSDGPRRMFYNPDGSEISPGNLLFGSNGGIVLQKPDITAADGVSTSMVDFNPFFGTSAAAPHAAAIAALVKEALPGFSAIQVRDLLYNTAIDIEAAGIDRDAGHGIMMADKAIESIGFSLENTSTTESSSSYNNGNGVLEPGEIGYFNFTLKNNTQSSFTNVMVEVTSNTPGLTMINSSFNVGTITNDYNSQNQIRFALTQNLACSRELDFKLAVKYDGGSISPQTFNHKTAKIGRLLAPITAVLGSSPASGFGFATTSGLAYGTLTRQISSNQCFNSLPPTNCSDGLVPFCFSNPFTLFSHHAYIFSNQNETESQCITVKYTKTGEQFQNLNFVTYNHQGFNPLDIKANVIGHATIFGIDEVVSYSFTVPAGENFTVVVNSNSAEAPLGVGTAYTFEINQRYCSDVNCVATSPIILSPETHVAGSSKFTGTAGLPFSLTFSSTGGSGFQDFFTGEDQIPPGLTLSKNSTSATLSGIPTTAYGSPPNGEPWLLIGLDALGCATPDINTYYIQIDPCDPVAIFIPASNNGPVCPNSPINLSVGVSGQGPFTYEWSGPAGTFTNGNTSTPTLTGAVSGTYSVTVSNFCGSVTSSTDVIINSPPTINIPGDFNMNTDPGLCLATVDQNILFNHVTVSGTPTPILSIDVNTQYGVGTFNGSASASNACGSDMKNIPIVVTDNTPPQAICKNINVEIEGSNVSIVGEDVNNGSFDACGIQSFMVNGQNSVALTNSNLGFNEVALSVTDIYGNQSSCDAIINVINDLCINGNDGIDSDNGGLPDDCDCSPNDDFNDKLILSRDVNIGMDFDGVNDYLYVQDAPLLNPEFQTSLTFEAWIKPDLSNPYNTILSKGNGGGGQTAYIFDTFNSSSLALYLGSSSGGGEWFNADKPLVSNTWVHVAAVYDNDNSSLTFYYDGEFVKVVPVLGNLYADDTQPFYIGRQGYACNCNFFKGQMEEVRVWSSARTQGEIKEFMSRELTGIEQNLLAYYNFNNGIPAGNNTGLTEARDNTVNGQHATLSNFFQNGSTSNWSGNTLPMVVVNKDTVDLCLTCPENLNIGMDFDGVDDYITIQNDIDLIPTSTNSVTFEGWIYPVSSSNELGIITASGIWPDRNHQISYYNSNNKILITGTGFGLMLSNQTVPLNTWTHIAVAFDKTETKIFINGQLDATKTHTLTPNNLGFDVTIGNQASGSPAIWNFQGKMDEIRYWKGARTESQIMGLMNRELYGAEGNLIAYYNFNNGSPNVNNTSLNVLPDLSLNRRDAVLSGFAKTGTASNWVNTSKSLESPKNAAMDFDGLNDFISIPNNPELIPTSTNAVTVEAWIYPAGDPDISVITESGTWPDRNHQIYLDGSKLVVTGTGVNVMIASDTIPFFQWTHIAVVFDKTVRNIYVNGQLKTTAVQTLTANNLGFNITIGNQASGSPASWNFLGKIDDLRYWDHARSEEQISDNMLQEISGVEAGLAAYYNFNEGLPAANNTALLTIDDISRNGNVGTLNGITRSGSISNWVSGPLNFGDADKDGRPNHCDNCYASKNLVLDNHTLKGIYRGLESITLGSGLNISELSEVTLMTPQLIVSDHLQLPINTEIMVTPFVCADGND